MNINQNPIILNVDNLHASIQDTEILKGINLTVRSGEIHAIMGLNGSGKSTFAKVLAGHPDYHVTQGSIQYEQQDLLELSAEERAQAGVFLAFQYPIEIPGVTMTNFLKTALNAQRRRRGEEEMDAMAFVKLLRVQAKALDISEDMLKRPVNVGFSGGEKKRAEALQMAMLQPKFAVLDETDSGLDIDALKVVAGGVNALRDKNRGMLIITHYQRLLDYIIPDKVHVLAAGRIAKSGGPELALELEREGYAAFSSVAA